VIVELVEDTNLKKESFMGTLAASSNIVVIGPSLILFTADTPRAYV